MHWALVAGCTLYALAHLAVQVVARSDRLVPIAWTPAIVLVDLAVPALALGLGDLVAWPVLVVGLLSLPMAAHVATRRRQHLQVAEVGAREIEARRILRRPSPPEVERVLTPLAPSRLPEERARLDREVIERYRSVQRARQQVSA